MRVVLVDFAVLHRFQCGVLIPYLQGLLRSRGVEARTFRMGLRAFGALDDDSRVRVSGDDLRAILDVCEREAPDVVVFSHPPAPEVVAALREGRQAPVVHWFDFLESRPLDDAWMRTTWGFSGDELLRARPDYSFVAANQVATLMRPLPYLVLGGECTYRHRLPENEFFSGVDYPEGVAEGGCSFCAIDSDSIRGVYEPDRAADAFASAMTTCPWGDFRRRVRVVGAGLLPRLTELIRVYLETGELGEVDLLHSSRVDDILRHEDEIRGALDLLTGSDARIQFNLIGVENFSDDELERFNKGISPTDIVMMLLLLWRLKRRYPDNFDYEEYGGLSLILFTPWTRIEDLRFNYHFIRLAEIEGLCSKLFTARLQLTPALPLTWLADRDGLLSEKYADPLFDKARNSFYPGELPWRFADPQVHVFNRISMRLEQNPALEDDDLYSRVQRWLTDAGFRTPLDAAVFLLGRLTQEADIGLDELLQTHAPRAPDAWEGLELLPEGFWEEEKSRIASGTRKAGKLEVGTRARADEMADLASRTFQQVTQVESPQGGVDVFYADDAGALDLLKATSARMYHPRNEDEQRDAVREAGRLLGYPSCCVEAYVRDRLYRVQHQMLAWMLRRYQEPVEMPARINPFCEGPVYVPCSCRCEATAGRMQLSGHLHDLCRLPVVFLLPITLTANVRVDGIDSLQNCVFIQPTGELGDSLGYRPVQARGHDPRLAHILDGDRLEAREGRLTVFRGDEKLYTFCLEVGIWHHQHAFDVSFWRPFIGYLVYRQLEAGRRRWTADPDSATLPPPRRYMDLQRFVEASLAANQVWSRASGYRYTGSLTGSRQVLAGFVDADGGPAELVLQWKEDAVGHLAVGRRLAVCIPADATGGRARLDTLAREVLEVLERFLSVHQDA